MSEERLKQIFAELVADSERRKRFGIGSAISAIANSVLDWPKSQGDQWMTTLQRLDAPKITPVDRLRYFLIRLLAGGDLIVSGSRAPEGFEGHLFLSRGQKAYVGNVDGVCIIAHDAPPSDTMDLIVRHPWKGE